MELKRWSENCVYANRTADAAGREWNADPPEPEYRRVAPGEQCFAVSFSESGLAQLRNDIGAPLRSKPLYRRPGCHVERSRDILLTDLKVTPRDSSTPLRFGRNDGVASDEFQR
jgi:hypothetical protein